MIDHPLQFVVSLGLWALVGWRVWAVRRGRGRERFQARHWSLRWLGRIGTGFVAIILLIATLDATTLMHANLCIEFEEGQAWCNHGVPEESAGVETAEGDRP